MYEKLDLYYQVKGSNLTYVKGPRASITAQEIPSIRTDGAEIIIFMGREFPIF